MTEKVRDRIAYWPEYWKEVFEERVGIMMYQANVSQEEAEQAAFDDCVRQRQNGDWPQHDRPGSRYRSTRLDFDF